MINKEDINSRTESSSVLSDDDQNEYYIDSNNVIYYVSSNGNTINLASTTGALNSQRNECYLLRNGNNSTQLKSNLLIADIEANNGTGENGSSRIGSSSFSSSGSYVPSSTSSTFTELQPASAYNQLPSIDTLSGSKSASGINSSNHNELQCIFLQ